MPGASLADAGVRGRTPVGAPVVPSGAGRDRHRDGPVGAHDEGRPYAPTTPATPPSTRIMVDALPDNSPPALLPLAGSALALVIASRTPLSSSLDSRRNLGSRGVAKSVGRGGGRGRGRGGDGGRG